MIELCCEYLSVTVHLTVSSYHVTYAFQSESTLYSCLNVKELLAWNRHNIWNIECGLTLKRMHDMIRTYIQMHCTVKYSQHSSIIQPVWLNGWVYELSGCEFESRCSHLNFRYRACFEQEFPWHSGNYRVRIHSEMRTWYDKNMQSDTSICSTMAFPP